MILFAYRTLLFCDVRCRTLGMSVDISIYTVDIDLRSLSPVIEPFGSLVRLYGVGLTLNPGGTVIFLRAFLLLRARVSSRLVTPISTLNASRRGIRTNEESLLATRERGRITWRGNRGVHRSYRISFSFRPGIACTLRCYGDAVRVEVWFRMILFWREHNPITTYSFLLPPHGFCCPDTCIKKRKVRSTWSTRSYPQ